MIGGGFFSDDFVYVVGNRSLQSTPLWEVWRWFGQRTNPYEFLPIRDLSYRLDLALFGLDPTGYKWHNLLLYLAGGLAVWFACRGLLPHLRGPRQARSGSGGESGPWVAAVATLFFLAHPAHAESVAWVSGRKDLLSTFFALMALGSFARAIDTQGIRRRWLAGAYLFFVLAIMSKAAVLAILVPMGLLVLALPRHAFRAWIATAPVVAAGGVWLAIVVGQGTTTGVRADPFLTEVMSAQWFESGPRILGYLVRLSVAPVDLRLIYDLDLRGVTRWALVVVGYAALAGAGLATVRIRRDRSAVGFGGVFFVACCLPYLQIVPFANWSLASDRFLCLALFGLALMLAGLLSRFGRRRLLIGSVVLSVTGFVLTARQANLWAEPDRLVERTARSSPGLFTSQNLLVGQVLIPQRRYDEAEIAASTVRDPVGRTILTRYVRSQRALESGDWERARAEADGLGWLVDRQSEAYLLVLVGRLAEAGGDEIEALRRFDQAERRAWTQQDLDTARSLSAAIRAGHAERLARLREQAEARPGDFVAQGNLANLEMELFLLDDAEARFRGILSEHPDVGPARYNLGLTLNRQGRFSEAAEELRAATTLGIATPDAWNNLATALKNAGQVEAAKEAYREALARAPNHCHASINLGRLHLALQELDAARRALSSAEASCRELGWVIDLYLRQVDQAERH